MAKPILKINSDGTFLNTVISIDDAPVQDCVHILFQASPRAGVTISYVTAEQTANEVLYKVTEFISHPVEREEGAMAFEIQDSREKIITREELDRFVPGFLINVFKK